jgi:hypothetical protein
VPWESVVPMAFHRKMLSVARRLISDAIAKPDKVCQACLPICFHCNICGTTSIVVTRTSFHQFWNNFDTLAFATQTDGQENNLQISGERSSGYRKQDTTNPYADQDAFYCDAFCSHSFASAVKIQLH